MSVVKAGFVGNPAFFRLSCLDFRKILGEDLGMRALLLSLLISVPTWAATVITESVGQVANHVVTSREVQICTVIDNILFPSKGKSGLVEVRPEQAEFRNHVTSVLLESVIAMEAESFNVGVVSDKDLAEALAKIEKATAGKSYWGQLDVSPTELKVFANRKLVAKSFMAFKTASMVGIITDQEAQAYYDKNRVKFGSTPFAGFKENIKTFLAQQQMEERLRTWFEVIKRKYKVRNFI
ncbi:MAG: hypothetical protein ACKOX6_12245 [Bdellovibrio sp.]